MQFKVKDIFGCSWEVFLFFYLSLFLEVLQMFPFLLIDLFYPTPASPSPPHPIKGLNHTIIYVTQTCR